MTPPRLLEQASAWEVALLIPKAVGEPLVLTIILRCFFSPGWNELLIASFSHRSIAVKDGILLATGLHVHRNSAHSAGVGAIFDRWGLMPGVVEGF